MIRKACWGMVLAIGFLLAGSHAIAGSYGEFSEQAVVLNPPPLPDGSDVSDIFSDWGITLSSESGTAPVMGTRPVIPNYEIYVGIDSPAVLNATPDGKDAGSLVITFNSPARRVYLEMGAQSTCVGTCPFGKGA